MLHLEFIVDGPPVSYQTRDKANLAAWKSRIRAVAASCWRDRPAISGRLKCTILNFHEGEHPTLDDDNMVKPIRDALNGLIFEDDAQIRHSETIHVAIDAPIRIRRASALLLSAYSRGDVFLYIRIDDAPEFIQLPG